MNNTAKKAWVGLLADVLAGGHPFNYRSTGRDCTNVATKAAILFAHSSGEGYNPQDSCGLTAAGVRYINSAFHDGRLLGCSPYEYRSAKYFRKKLDKSF